MCDTLVATSTATADGSVIFAKNSDRKANECQPLCWVPAERHPAGAEVGCTHRSIPQAPETFAVLGSRPWWMWGFEMGVNEHGVAIGNEAVYGREPHETDGLLGMDLLRLALERGRSAYEALHVLTDLLERYGQGGNADITESRSYHNAYILADPREAWVLETAGRFWVAERVRGRRSISNCYTITTTWDEAAVGLVDHARARGWTARGGDFSFAAAYGDPAQDVSSGRCRFGRSRAMLGERVGLAMGDLLAVLRDHAGQPPNPVFQTTICMHERPPLPGATAASLVVELREDRPRPLQARAWHLFGSPCLAAATPFWPAAGGVPAELERGGATFDRRSPWWLLERLQRRSALDPGLAEMMHDRLAALEAANRNRAVEAEARATSLAPEVAAATLVRASAECTAALLAVARELDAWIERNGTGLTTAGDDVSAAWAALNRPAGLAWDAGELVANRSARCDVPMTVAVPAGPGAPAGSARLP